MNIFLILVISWICCQSETYKIIPASSFIFCDHHRCEKKIPVTVAVLDMEMAITKKRSYSIWVYQPFKNPIYSSPPSVFNLSLIPPSSLISQSSPSPLPPSSRPRALTHPSRSAAAVTGGQEVKAKVECHTHRVTVMPGCCVRLWMESSECQTRWRAPWRPDSCLSLPFPEQRSARRAHPRRSPRTSRSPSLLL